MELMLKDQFSQTLRLTEPQEEVRLVFERRSFGNVSIFMEAEVKSLSLYIEGKPDCNAKVFLQNCSKQEEAEVILLTDVDRDASVQFGLLDLENTKPKTRLHGYLHDQGAALDIYTGQLCMAGSDKNNEVKIVHDTGHTSGHIHNFAVCFDEGKYFMAADGTIKKGCSQSESHQETRVLTMGTKHKAEVIPILYIDEDDVKASHALTIGQPDEAQLYYLQSRGLTKEQAMGLLAIGYFMPVIDLVDDEDMHEKLRFEMEEKAGLYER